MRPAFDALFDIDDAMADVVAQATQPALGAIKLAWWREELQRLDFHPPPAEPRLQLAASELLTRGIRGEQIAWIHDGWAELLAEAPDRVAVGERGMIIFGLAQRLLRSAEPHDADLGRIWADADIARRHRDVSWLTPDALDSNISALSMERRARPLTGLAALAWRDHRDPEPFEPEGTPGRAWALFRHRMTGHL